MPDPDQKNMKDHTETVQLDYDPAVISYRELLDHFFSNHNPNRKKYRDREYISLILYHDEEQKKEAEKRKSAQEEKKQENIQTEISPYTGFNLAKERQQKWHIKRVAEAMNELNDFFSSEETLRNATITARLNGLAKGCGKAIEIKQEVNGWNIEDTERRKFLDIIDKVNKN